MNEVESNTAAAAEGRLGAKDLRVLLLWILAGLAGAGIAYKYFFRAFPEASLDLRVSRTQALEVARNFFSARGQKLDRYQSSIVFSVEDFSIEPNSDSPPVKTYLERELGLEQANRLMASEIVVWYWDTRFFRQGQQEEFRLRVSPAGRVVGMTHVIEEARAGASLDQDAARAVAEAFLRTGPAVDLAAYDFLAGEASATERPKRRDWSFTWERRGFKVKDATYRLRVAVQGDEAGSYEEFLKIPEKWQRDFQSLRSSNVVYQLAGEVPGYFLLGAAFFVLYQQGRRGIIGWRGALKLGAVVAGLFFASQVNEWPLTRFGYDTNSSYLSFLLQKTALAALGSLAAGLIVALAFAAGEPLYRHNQPNQLRLGVALSWRGIRSKEFFRSCVIGLAMAGGSIGFVVLFYVVGQKFGIWAPQEIKYTNVASTALPWLSPLATSLLAATSEEFIFRLFAIPFLHRLTGSKALAILLPAFIWGFGHSIYPVEPGYARGIEVGIIGIVVGLVMLRYGILATLIWHYTVDAILIGLFLLRSESLYFRVSGAIVGAGVLIPLGIAGVAYLVRRRFEADPRLLNGAAPLPESADETPEAAAEAPGKSAYQALDSRALGIVLGCGALGALLFLAVKAEVIGDFVRYSINARQAAAKAGEVLRQRKIDPRRYKRAIESDDSFNPYTNEYLRRQVGIAGANRLYREKVPSAFWRTRYFRDSEKEEYEVILLPDGALHSVHHELEEKAPGAALSKDEAQARAEAYLRDEKKLDLANWKLVEATSKKHPARIDHTFTWEELASVGEAHVRARLRVQGDEVSGYQVFVKIPEEWERRQSQKTMAWYLHLVGQILFYVTLGVTVLVIFFRNLKTPTAAGVPWRRFSIWALWGLLITLVNFGNKLSVLLFAYDTQIPFKSFVAVLLVGLLLGAAAFYSLLFFLFGLAWFFLSRVFGSERLPSWRGMPAAYYRDAFWLGLAGTGVVLGLARLQFLLARIWPTAKKALGDGLPAGLDLYVPAASAIGSAVLAGLFVTALVAVAAGFVAGYVRQRWQQLGLVLCLAVVMSGGWGSPADFAKKVLVQLAVLGVYWWAVTRVVRFNLLAYFLVAASVALVGAADGLLRQPNEFFRANGYAVVVALLALLAWPLVEWRRSAGSQGPGVGPVERAVETRRIGFLL